MRRSRWHGKAAPRTAVAVGLVGLALACLAGCPPFTGPEPSPVGTLELRVNWPVDTVAASAVGVRVIPTGTDRLRVTITGSDMETIRVEVTRAEMEAGGGVRRIPVPVGSDRLVAIEALDAEGGRLASGSSLVQIEPGVTAYARIALAPDTGTGPPPEVISRTMQLTGFTGNFVPLASAVVEANATNEDVIKLPTGAVSGTLSLDYFPVESGGVRPILATLEVHSGTELWVVRGYTLAVPGDELALDTGVTNGYVLSPGGYTTDFTGSLLDWDLVPGPLLEIIRGSGGLRLRFGDGGPLESRQVTGDVEVNAGPEHTLIGSLRGELVF